MTYSIVAILAIVIHLIVNVDVFLDLRKKGRFPGELYYLFFLISVIAYHIADGAWGFIYDTHLSNGLFVDTTIYFVAMAASILLLGLFVTRYLGYRGKIEKVILIIGLVAFALQIIAIVVNFFTPVLFGVTEDCVYSAGPLRFATLEVQIGMFIILALFTLLASLKATGSLKRRHLTISLFCVFLIAAITLQVFFPLLPMYSLGYLVGITVLHTFVVEDEKFNQRKELEETKQLVMIDTLTGVMSKHAYVDVEAEIDNKISKGEMKSFAVVVFDINDLKHVNDTLGHDSGDNYVIKSTKLIAEYFRNTPIYRVGGDEFVVILEDKNYEDRNYLIDNFNHKMDENVKNDDPIVVSAGISSFDPEEDNTIIQIFTRADREMYERKHHLKAKQNIDAIQKLRTEK